MGAFLPQKLQALNLISGYTRGLGASQLQTSKRKEERKPSEPLLYARFFASPYMGLYLNLQVLFEDVEIQKGKVT